jgi:hypothetical protein
MKRFLFVALTLPLVCANTFAQDHFVPTKPNNVSDADFRTGQYILKNSYQQLAEDNYRIVAIDYWNFATAYYRMGQPKEMIYDYLIKSKFTNNKDFCEIVNIYHKKKGGIDSVGFYKLLGDDYKALVADCSKIKSDSVFDIEAYIKKNSYNKELIYTLRDLLNQDRKWRKGDDPKTQTDIDKSTIMKVEEVTKEYGYPGTSMVGSKFDFVIWIIIQHAALEFQEKYLDLIAKAVQENQLGKTSLRMLLDGIYHKKTGFQIFGFEIGVPFSDDKTIQEVKEKYNL